MKMLVLLSSLILCFSVNAYSQCNYAAPMVESFNDVGIVDICWNKVDQDGDGMGWFAREQIGFYGGYKTLDSRSWGSGSGALTPDNWIISHAIDLSAFSTKDNLKLSWRVRSEIADLSHEFYTVYAGTSGDISALKTSPIQRGEYVDEIGGGGAHVFVTRSLDLSSFVGDKVYIAFRHHNSTNQYNVSIDDIAITKGVPACTKANPEISLFSTAATELVAGGTDKFTVTVRNLDSGYCPSSEFDLTAHLPNGFTVDESVKNLTLAGGQGGYGVFNVTSAISTEGQYNLEFKAKDIDTQEPSHEIVSKLHNVNVVVERIIPSAPADLAARVRKGVITLNWSESLTPKDIAKYRVFTVASGQYTLLSEQSASQLSYSTSMPSQGSISFVVRAVSRTGHESSNSNIVTIEQSTSGGGGKGGKGRR